MKSFKQFTEARLGINNKAVLRKYPNLRVITNFTVLSDHGKHGIIYMEKNGGMYANLDSLKNSIIVSNKDFGAIDWIDPVTFKSYGTVTKRGKQIGKWEHSPLGIINGEPVWGIGDTVSKYLSEGKQVGELYHFTNGHMMKAIIKDNKFIGDVEAPYISFTRDRSLNPIGRGFKGTELMIVIDGDKISQNYKTEPFNWKGNHFPKGYTGKPGQKYDYNFEAETRVKGPIRNAKKYIKRIIFLDNLTYYDSILFLDKHKIKYSLKGSVL